MAMKLIFHRPMTKWKTLAPWFACSVLIVACPSVSAQGMSSLFTKRAIPKVLNNAKNIGLMLFEFDADFGSFPNETTAGEVEKSSGKKLPAADKTSNAMFRQFFAADITDNEELFFAEMPGVTKGGVQQDAAQALGTGKNAFSYIAGLTSEVDSATPIVLCPLISGTTKFNPKPFGGKAVILLVDGSVRLHAIEKDGSVLVDGVELLSKEHPVWKGKTPDIRYPDLPAAK